MDPQIDKALDEKTMGLAPGFGGPIDLVNARYGADLVNCGALIEGLRVWPRWRSGATRRSA